MKQGSILSFLQPKAGSKNPASQSIQVQVTETTPKRDLDDSLTDESPAPVQTRKLDDVQIKILKDPRASVVALNASHLDKLKGITTTLFPVRYSDKFFKECLEAEKTFAVAFVAMYEAKPVGWVRCRYEPFPNKENEVYQQLYVQIIGILAPFRGMGLAKALLEMATAQAQQSPFDVRAVYAHVWERNEDALLWYQRQGFIQIMLQPQYYRKLHPAGAWIVRKELMNE